MKVELVGAMSSINAIRSIHRRDDHYGLVTVAVPTVEHGIADAVSLGFEVKGREAIDGWWNALEGSSYVKVTIEVIDDRVLGKVRSGLREDVSLGFEVEE